MYNLGYIVVCPILALMEMGIAGKNAVLQRDMELFQDRSQVRPLENVEVDENNDDEENPSTS